jgi:hypothetical protein
MKVLFYEVIKMNDVYNLELTANEFICVTGGLALYHKELAKTLYESMEGLVDKDESIDVEEFDRQHKTLMGLYDQLATIAEQIKE